MILCSSSTHLQAVALAIPLVQAHPSLSSQIHHQLSSVPVLNLNVYVKNSHHLQSPVRIHLFLHLKAQLRAIVPPAVAVAP